MADGIGPRERRNSISVLGSSSISVFSVHGRTPSDDLQRLRKKPRRNSAAFFGSRNASPTRPLASLQQPCSPRIRMHQKKRTSVLGSLRSLQSWEDDDASPARSRASSAEDDDCPRDGSPRGSVVVLHHGEVQTIGGMWRKKSHYLVLTDTHLVRFKSQARAAEVYPTISGSGPNHNRYSTASVHSLPDAPQPQPQPPSIPADSAVGIPLNSIVAAYVLDDGRPVPTVEVAYLDDRTQRAALMQMQMADLHELNLWMTRIRSAAEAARIAAPLPFDSRSIDQVVRTLEQARDYDPATFHMFRVIQIASSKQVARSSSDDLAKLSPTGFFLALGTHKLHLVPMPKVPNRSSVVSLSDLESPTSFGLMTLTGLSMEWGGDSLSLTFRLPCCKHTSVFLASVHAAEIAFWIRQQTEFLRPLWKRQPYEFVGPRELADEDNFPPVDLDEDHGCFDRTLVAYAAAYDVDTSNIRYTVDTQCEDAPCFRLLPPAGTTGTKRRRHYTALELIAVFRSLRYNESFRSISFRGVNLDALQALRDPYGPDRDAHLSRSGARIQIPGHETLTVLALEIRALALKSKWLRRLDFSYCITRTPSSDAGGGRDPGCGIPEAIFPVCRRELTSVDWVVLNGIKLGESDLDYLVDAASQRGSHLRAVEVGNCGLSVHDVDLLMSTMTAQELTLEAINISGVQGRLSPDVLQQHVGYFGNIRKLDLSRISRTSGPEPLLSAETLFKWRLEELSLSQTAVNAQTVDAISIYLASDSSRGLRVLQLDQCGLTGEDVATFLHSMTDDKGRPRNLHLHVNENRLGHGCSHIFRAIAQNKTPTALSMRMIDFKKEEHFRDLVEALRKNQTLRVLDISKASLPYDAGPETCTSLRLMLEENETLEELDISGESAHLDVARFGIGLNEALTGLKKNRSLTVLRIEHQKLGLPGANTLASVLEENTSLRQVYCEHNDMNLQSFTVLVNGLQRNKSLLFLSAMESDRAQSLDKVRREIESVSRPAHESHGSATSTIRRSIHAAMHAGHIGVSHKLSKHPPAGPHARSGASLPSAHSSPGSGSGSGSEASPFADHNVELVLKSLSERWDAEIHRMRRYLFRNYSLAHSGLDCTGQDGTADVDDDSVSDGRPSTAVSLSTMLHELKLAVSTSAVEISPSVTDSQSPSPTDTEAPGIDTASGTVHDTLIDASRASSETTSAFSASGGGYRSSCISSSGMALPVSALPAITHKAGSVRSTSTGRSSINTVSTGTGPGSRSGSRSRCGSASSTLRDLLANAALRERRKMERMRGTSVCVSAMARGNGIHANTPPKLDWAPPQFGLGDFH